MIFAGICERLNFQRVRSFIHQPLKSVRFRAGGFFSVSLFHFRETAANHNHSHNSHSHNRANNHISSTIVFVPCSYAQHHACSTKRPLCRSPTIPFNAHFTPTPWPIGKTGKSQQRKPPKPSPGNNVE